MNSSKTQELMSLSLPKVSIITVCFNAAETLECTIKSVINQSYQNIEYIIIDGCSKDGTIDIIKKYERKITKWLSEPDNGIYDAMNKGIQISSGELIAFLNADDWYEDGAIDFVVRNYQMNQNVDILHGNEIRRTEDGKFLWAMRPNQNYKKLKTGMTLFHSACFITRKCYDQWGLYDINYSIAADYDLLLRFYVHGAKICHIDKALTNFRLIGISWTKWSLLLHECKLIQIKYGLPPLAANINYVYKSVRYIIKILLVKFKLSKVVELGISKVSRAYSIK